MKIVLPVHHFPPRYSAGAELYTFRLARWLQAHGHSVEVVCVEAIDANTGDGLRADLDTYEGVPVWRLAFDLGGAHRRWQYDNPLLRAWFSDYFGRAQVDVAHFQAGYLLGAAPIQAAAAAGVPSVLTLHDYWFLCPRITLQRGDGSLCDAVPRDPAGCAWCMRLESRRYRIPDQLTHGFVGHAAQSMALLEERHLLADRRAQLLPTLRLPDAVIAPSHFLAQQFTAYVPPERTHVLRYGLNLEPFAAQQRSPENAALRIGYLGQVAPHKGVHLLVEAFGMLRASERPLELHIHGGLEANLAYVERLRKLANGDPRIHFHGRFAGDQVVRILSNLDTTVVPSTWYENSPLAIMEAHAAGVPVITAALGGMAELVRDEVDGLHFEPSNAPDLARQLQRLHDLPGLLPLLRLGVRPPHSIDQEMQTLMHIYEQVVERRAIHM